jgi:AcrR family transcriptional regulator
MGFCRGRTARHNQGVDPRVARTRASLQHALLTLAHEEGLDAVTVGAITDRAGVNRSTFYQHYDDKDTLLADALEAAMAEVGEAFSGEVGADGIPVEIHGYLVHVRDNADLYRDVLGDHGSAIVMSRLRRRLDAIIVGSITAAPENPYSGVPLDVVSAGLSGAALGVVGAWLRHEPLPPVAHAAAWMWAVITGAGGAVAPGGSRGSSRSEPNPS